MSALAPMMKMLQRIRRSIEVAEDALLALLLIAMVLLAVAQIILRNVADMGISWSEPSLRLAVLWMTLLGAMAATRRGKHISIDVVSQLVPRRIGSVIQRVTDLFSAGVCGVIAWHAARFVRDEWAAGALALGALPAWIAQIVIPAGFAIIALRFLFNAVFQQPSGASR